jgi:hypothetical protein
LDSPEVCGSQQPKSRHILGLFVNAITIHEGARLDFDPMFANKVVISAGIWS